MKVFYLVVLMIFYAGCHFTSGEISNLNSVQNQTQPNLNSTILFENSNFDNFNQVVIDSEKFKEDEKTLKNNLEGIWQREDKQVVNGCDDKIEISFQPKIESFCVEGNQIYIVVKYALNPKRKELNLYLVKPDDLGRGGAGLSWENYDRKTSIATIDTSNIREKKIHVKWNGFYDRKTKRVDDYGKDYEGIYHKIDKENLPVFGNTQK